MFRYRKDHMNERNYKDETFVINFSLFKIKADVL